MLEEEKEVVVAPRPPDPHDPRNAPPPRRPRLVVGAAAGLCQRIEKYGLKYGDQQ